MDGAVWDDDRECRPCQEENRKSMSCWIDRMAWMAVVVMTPSWLLQMPGKLGKSEPLSDDLVRLRCERPGGPCDG